MRLESEFIRLPLALDVDRLREEALQFSEYEWDYHPQRYDGNTALNLVSKDGERSDSYVGTMQATEALERCPYVQQIMANFGAVIGRSRFMRLAPGKGVPAHSDTDYSWRDRVRIHIPIITDPSIIFSSCGNIDVHMQAGEAWIFDNWREHAVLNDSDINRIHLVIDTVGSSQFWKLVEMGLDPKINDSSWSTSIQKINYRADELVSLSFEQHNLLPVRSPDEVAAMCADFLSDIEYLQSHPADTYSKVSDELRYFVQDWRALWALHWDSANAIGYYQTRANTLRTNLQPLLVDIALKSNGVSAYEVISAWLEMMTDANVARLHKPSTDLARGRGDTAFTPLRYAGAVPEFKQPVLVVAAPRSGSTMLFEALKCNKELWTIGDESHREIESIPELNLAAKGFVSNRVLADDCTPQIKARIIDAFMFRLQNARTISYAEMPVEVQPSAIRFLEKTPKNALRIPFFKKMFPDAKFIYLHRQAEANIGSIIDAWQSGKFVTYPDLPGWQGEPWSLLLPEGWQEQAGKSQAGIAAYQWASTNQTIITDLANMPAADYTVVAYEDLLAETGTELARLCQFMQVPFGPKMQSFADTGFPNSKYALTAPSQAKWLRHEADIRAVKQDYRSATQAIADFIAV